MTPKTISLFERQSKVHLAHLGTLGCPDCPLSYFLDGLPKQLAANDLRVLAKSIALIRHNERPFVAAIGGHVIKTGCGPYLIDWINKGVLTGVAMNGAAAIHDLELAIAGHTSEDVEKALADGTFGMAKETPYRFGAAAALAKESKREKGFGYYLGKILDCCEHADSSVLAACYRKDIPCTVHVAIGCDTVHMHAMDGAALGAATMIDFRLLTEEVSQMQDGGVWLNLGSAVQLPEVFLKAYGVCRARGLEFNTLVTANMDMERRYRTSTRVLGRGAVSFELIGHHEIMVPLLHAATALAIERSGDKDAKDKE